MTKRDATTDIAIVGGGAVGLAAGLALARDGRHVTLIGMPAAPASGRTVALLGDSWSFLESLDLGDALFAKAAALAVMRIVDDSGSLFRQPPVEFRASEIGREAFGWSIRSDDLTELLNERAARTDNLRLVTGSVERLEAETRGVLLEGDGFEPLRTRLVVGADGRRSRVREAAGIEAREWRYPQVALTAILSHARDHRETSTEFHTHSGPCTLAPLPGRYSSLTWLVDPDEAEALSVMDDAVFARRVERQVHSLLGVMKVVGPRGRVPMGGLSVERFGSGRMVLAGEAAHVFPPIGAQGLNLGLRDVMALREALHGADDPGAEKVVAEYDRARGADVHLRTGAVDMLNRTLLADIMPADLLRGAGLLALSRIGSLRRLAMRQGLGSRAA